MSDVPLYRLALDTPVGWLTAYAAGDALIELTWARSRRSLPSPLLRETAKQLRAYFKGALTAFDLPLAPHGSEHEQRVWAAMRTIPYGETATYGELAAAARSSPRAVGRACGANPLPIIIPCHRVTAAGGALGGYSGAGGPATKKQLLTLESRHSGLFAQRAATDSRVRP